MNTLPRTRDIQFERQALRHELKLLEREQRHLREKGRERGLTRWEIERIEELLEETMSLLSKFGKAVRPIS